MAEEHEHEFILEIPEFAHLSYEVEEGIALVTLRRPEALNALSQDLLRELAEVAEVIAQDPEARVAIFTGEGKAFAAGADLKEIAALKDPFMGPGVRPFGPAGLLGDRRFAHPHHRRHQRLRPWAGGWSWPWPATSGWPPRGPGWACLRWAWASSPALAGPSACPASSAGGGPWTSSSPGGT
jgi:hypothetical protein